MIIKYITYTPIDEGSGDIPTGTELIELIKTTFDADGKKVVQDLITKNTASTTRWYRGLYYHPRLKFIGIVKTPKTGASVDNYKEYISLFVGGEATIAADTYLTKGEHSAAMTNISNVYATQNMLATFSTTLDSRLETFLTKAEAGNIYATKVDMTNLASINDTAVSTTSTFSSSKIDTEFAKKSDITSLYKLKGSIANKEALPTDKELGDVYNAIDTGMNYVWDGATWDELGGFVDLSGYMLKTDKASDSVKLGGKEANAFVQGERIIDFKDISFNFDSYADVESKTSSLEAFPVGSLIRTRDTSKVYKREESGWSEVVGAIVINSTDTFTLFPVPSNITPEFKEFVRAFEQTKYGNFLYFTISPDMCGEVIEGDSSAILYKGTKIPSGTDGERNEPFSTFYTKFAKRALPFSFMIIGAMDNSNSHFIPANTVGNEESESLFICVLSEVYGKFLERYINAVKGSSGGGSSGGGSLEEEEDPKSSLGLHSVIDTDGKMIKAAFGTFDRALFEYKDVVASLSEAKKFFISYSSVRNQDPYSHTIIFERCEFLEFDSDYTRYGG